MRPKTKKKASPPKAKPTPKAKPKAPQGPLDTTLYAEVKRRRMEAGLTLEQLAERANLTPNYIGTVEHGQRDPSLSTLQGLANGLNVSLAELFGPPPALSPAALEMAELFNDAPEDMQNATLKLLRAIVKAPKL
jgi:transcriptional regulator with XRE-family HTH domain